MMSMMAAAGSSARATFSKPKASKPAATASKAKRQKAPDHAIREAARIYASTRAADAALDNAPSALFGSAEDARREREGARIDGRRERAIETAAAQPAETAAGVLLKADMLHDALEKSHGLLIGDKDGAWQLAASLAADVRRTAAPLTLAGLLAAEDASADVELIEVCAAWPAAMAAFNAEEQDGGPAERAMSALADRVARLQPTTLGGMLAKARVAKIEAKQLDGSYSVHCNYAADMGWDLSNVLLRLVGEGI